jgi:uncharacterized protein
MRRPLPRPPLRAPRRYLDDPFAVAGSGRAATTEVDDHVRDLVYQVLFTSPGERVNRPDFGCGLLDLVFEPNSDARAAATQLLVHGSLQRWLSDVVRIENVRIENVEAELQVEVTYTRLMGGEPLAVRFTAPASGAAP